MAFTRTTRRTDGDLDGLFSFLIFDFFLFFLTRWEEDDEVDDEEEEGSPRGSAGAVQDNRCADPV